MARESVAARRLADSLRPKAEDSRKFRLKKPLTFKALDAKRFAIAFAQVRDMSGNPKLTVEQFILSLISQTFGQMKKTEIEDQAKPEVVNELLRVLGGVEPLISEATA